MSSLRALALFATVVSLTLPSAAQLHRGVWFWGSTTLPGGGSSPFGSSVVVGDPVAEDETVNFFTLRSVKRVYGSYQNRPVSEPAVIAAWNTKLDTAGISSQLLIDGIAVNDPAEITSILTKITNRLINFNNALGTDAASKFDALHLDLEPQGLAAWDSGTPAVKRTLLDDLHNAYLAIRAHLDGAGFAAMPIYADIPFFWDKLPADGGSVGWTDASDRDTWYGNVAAVLEGISIMTFSKDNFAAIDTATAYERSGAMTGKARVGIQPKVGLGELWPTVLHFNAVMNQLETAYGPTGATDIENYAFWRHAIATTTPSVGDPISVTLSGVGPTPWTGGGGGDDDDPVIVFPGLPGFLYTVRHSERLGGQWSKVQRVQTTNPHDPEILSVRIEPRGTRGFWTVERTPLR